MSYNVTKAKASPEKFQTFEDLEVYKAAREFRKATYAVTRRLPDFEKYDLASQIRRAAVSLTNNMAEGHARADQWISALPPRPFFDGQETRSRRIRHHRRARKPTAVTV
jgi:23S rRNA-intervening sequence protein